MPPIDLEEIEQLFIYREVLEVAAVRLGGRDISDADFLEIESVLDAATPNATPEQLEAAGRQFHLWIAGIAHNAFISRGLGDALTRLQRTRWLENTPATMDGTSTAPS